MIFLVIVILSRFRRNITIGHFSIKYFLSKRVGEYECLNYIARNIVK